MLDSNQVTANVVHPGLIKSELMSDTPALLGGLLKAISRRAEKAAVTRYGLQRIRSLPG